MNYEGGLNQEVNLIDWEKLSLEEILAILNRLGIGFETVLRFLLTKIMQKKGMITLLMNLVKKLEIGVPDKVFISTFKLNNLLSDPKIPRLIKQTLNILHQRAINKFTIDTALKLNQNLYLN